MFLSIQNKSQHIINIQMALYVYLTNLTKIWNGTVLFLQSEKKSSVYPQRTNYMQPIFRTIFFPSSRKKERKK